MTVVYASMKLHCNNVHRVSKKNKQNYFLL